MGKIKKEGLGNSILFHQIMLPILKGICVPNPAESFAEFVEITKRLRKECPWDKVQTHESIKHSLIEEAYEVVESIDNSNLDELRKELGDILLHVVFHSNIAEEENAFTLDQVITGISKKMVDRHPHIFGDAKAGTAEEVKINW